MQEASESETITRAVTYKTSLFTSEENVWEQLQTPRDHLVKH